MQDTNNYVKFSSIRMEVPEGFELGKNVVFQGTGQIVKSEKFCGQGEADSKVFVVRPNFLEVKSVPDPELKEEIMNYLRVEKAPEV